MNVSDADQNLSSIFDGLNKKNGKGMSGQISDLKDSGCVKSNDMPKSIYEKQHENNGSSLKNGQKSDVITIGESSKFNLRGQKQNEQKSGLNGHADMSILQKHHNDVSIGSSNSG